jgi:hypothetical protein
MAEQMRKWVICKADEMIFSVLPPSHEDKVAEITLFPFVASKK